MALADLTEALFAPFRAGDLPPPAPSARVLILYGYEGIWPATLPADPVYHSFSRRETDRLRTAGRTVRATFPEAGAPPGLFDLVFLSAPRQTHEARAALAAACRALVPGGLVLAAAPKTAGGMRLKGWMEEAGLHILGTDSRAHCRTVWARKEALPAPECWNLWREEGAPRPGPHGFVSCPGLFGWDRVDVGSALLAGALPADLTGTGADFGCGYGYLSAHILKTCPSVQALHAFDDDARAVSCCAQNISAISHPATHEVHWADLSVPWAHGPRFEWIVMNPPFHEGAASDPGLGQRFIAAAAAALKTGGKLWMVANAHLPYGPLLAVLFGGAVEVFESSGFRIYRARR